jgi:hypothetical protein
MRFRTLTLATLAAVFALGAAGPAFAYDDWGRREWREHEWREHAWRRHEWREHEWREHRPHWGYYAPPPAYHYYAPPAYGYYR